MNERIRELAEQAGGNPNYKAFRGYFLPPPPDYIDPATVNLEKFAELIVGECVRAADEWYQYHNEIQWDPGEHIKQHFGVEE